MLRGMRQRRMGIALVPFVVLGTWSRAARAQDAPDSGMLSAGYIHSFVWGDSPAAGNGVEVSYAYYQSRRERIGIGLFLQLEDYSGTRREAFGMQANAWFFGAEAGWAHRGADADHASTHGSHLGLFASIGVALLSFRVVPPLSTIEPNHGTELSLTLGLKFFFALHGEMLETFSVPHGRPLRVAGSPRTTRGPLEIGWRDAAVAEHESVASFAALALDLLRHGAPRSLIRDCHAAARDELRHAQYCSTEAGASPDFPPLGRLVADHEPSSLEEVVVGCFLDGCLGEGYAAERARLASRHLDAPEGLMALAAEEAEHARLAWRVLDWTRRASPPTCARALRQALECSARLEPAIDVAYGVLPRALSALAFELTRSTATARARRLLRQIDSSTPEPLPA